MGDHFLAPIETIQAQAEYVAGVRSKVETADDAAGQVATQNFDLAFGLLCQAFPAAIRPVEERTSDTIRQLIQSLQHTDNNLRETAKGYQDAEQRILDLLRKLLQDLDIDLPEFGGDSVEPMPRVTPDAPVEPMPRVVPEDDGTVYV